MKTLLTGALVLLFTLPSFAGTTSDGYQPFTLSANPTARQITKLFIETTVGMHDPFMVLKRSARRRQSRLTIWGITANFQM